MPQGWLSRFFTTFADAGHSIARCERHHGKTIIAPPAIAGMQSRGVGRRELHAARPRHRPPHAAAGRLCRRRAGRTGRQRRFDRLGGPLRHRARPGIYRPAAFAQFDLRIDKTFYLRRCALGLCIDQQNAAASRLDRTDAPISTGSQSRSACRPAALPDGIHRTVERSAAPDARRDHRILTPRP